MNRALISVMTLSFTASLVVFGQHPTKADGSVNSCLDKARTQSEMNECANSDFTRLDREMNALYRRLLAMHKQDVVAVEKMRLAQEAWLKYRDAYIEAWYPESEKRSYGTVEPMCRVMILATLTQERVRVLRDMTAPKEGDVCAFHAAPPGQ